MSSFKVSSHLCSLFLAEPDPKQLFDKKLELGAPQLKEYEVLPKSLDVACEHLSKNEMLNKVLGEAAVQSFVALKGEEIKDFMGQISAWEISKADDY